MFELKSLKLKEELARRVREFSQANRIHFRITVPPTMKWWYWDEFGTATFSDKANGNMSGYMIPAPDNIDAKVLFFPAKDGTPTYRLDVWMEGIHPKHMVTSVWGQITDLSGQTVAAAILRSHYNFNSFTEIIRRYLMPNIKEIVRQSFEDNLNKYYPGGKRPEGKWEGSDLGGEYAWEVFEREAKIVEVED